VPLMPVDTAFERSTTSGTFVDLFTASFRKANATQDVPNDGCGTWPTRPAPKASEFDPDPETVNAEPALEEWARLQRGEPGDHGWRRIN